MRFIVFVLLLLLTASFAQAQFTPINSTISTPYGKTTVTTYRYSPTHTPSNGKGYRLGKRKYIITLKNDSTIRPKAELNLTDSTSFIEMKHKKTTINIVPAQTKEIWITNVFGEECYGIPSDSCWLFRITKGIIALYVPDPDMLPGNAIAIQKGDGPILPFTRTNLFNFIKGDEKALELAKKDLFLKAIEQYNKE
jgi:hypothetical protein